MPKPVELTKPRGRACWPNSDNMLGLYVAWAAMRRGQRVTLVHTPVGVQHYPWPVYSDSKSYSNRSIVAHGAKRPTSRMWAIAERRMSGAFVPFNRTCGTCAAEMGWSSYPGSVFADWQCCGDPSNRSRLGRAAKARLHATGKRRAKGERGATRTASPTR